MAIKEERYTTQEAAEILRLSVHTVRDKVRRGDFGPVYNFGRSYLISESQLEKFMEDRTSNHGRGLLEIDFKQMKRPKRAAKL